MTSPAQEPVKILNRKGTILKHLLTFISFFLVLTAPVFADPVPTAPLKEKQTDSANYLLAPGDLIEISVWKEEGMQEQQLLVAPDGNITFPLAGTIMAAGKPILAAVDADSEVAMVVKEEGIGWIVPPDAPDKLAEAILEARSDRERLAEMSTRARAAAEAKYWIQPVVEAYQRLLVA